MAAVVASRCVSPASEPSRQQSSATDTSAPLPSSRMRIFSSAGNFRRVRYLVLRMSPLSYVLPVFHSRIGVVTCLFAGSPRASAEILKGLFGALATVLSVTWRTRVIAQHDIPN